MDNFYLVYGEVEYLIEYNIKKIINKYINYNLIYYDLEITPLSDVIEEANTLGLFGNKLIICKNSRFLSRQQSSVSQDTSDLLQYLDNANNEVVIVFSNGSIDNSKKIVKKIKEIGTVILCDKLDNNKLFDIIHKKFNINNYKIENKAIDKIINLTQADMNLINNEINKLLMYKFDEKIITLKDVEEITSEKIEDNIFELIDAVIDNDKIKIFSIYQKLIDNFNYEPTKILVMIANQFRLLLQTKIMISKNINEKDIAKILEIHPYRVKLANQKSRNITVEKLKNYLLELSEIDYKIKSGTSNRFAALELFLINL